MPHQTPGLARPPVPRPAAARREGVAFSHAERVAHRDLKSSDVLVDGDARLWIVDYDSDLAEILDEVEDDDEIVLVSGFRGTQGRFTAQEVGSEYYDPAVG